MPRIAIIGAGLSGLALAFYLQRQNPACDLTLFEASARTGGIVETRREQGFTIELGPDSWVTEKPAARELATALGLADQLLPSNDSTRLTHILLHGRLETLPANLRLMVPLGPEALHTLPHNHLFTPSILQAFNNELTRAAELRRHAPTADESIASFTRRHFGRQVLDRLAAPLLSGVFGGDVRRLSAHAVLAPFVAMERQHGSLIAALGEMQAERRAANRPTQPIFTTLRSGLGTLIDTLTRALPPTALRLQTRVHRLERRGNSWRVHAVTRGPTGAQTLHTDTFDHVVLALPAPAGAGLLHPLDPALARLLPQEASSAILVAFAWPDATFTPPPGFGLLIPPSRWPASRLLAATFVDGKFPHRVPPGGRLLRVFLGTAQADRLLALPDQALATLALRELDRILRPHTGPLPPPALSAVRRWPHSLPQYAVGHLERAARFDRRLAGLPGLHLLGNALQGVGLPDLIRQARTLAEALPAS